MAAQEEGTQKRIEKTVEGPVCFSETQLVLFFCRQWAGATQQPNHVLKDNVSSLQQRKGLENNGKVPGHTKTAGLEKEQQNGYTGLEMMQRR